MTIDWMKKGEEGGRNLEGDFFFSNFHSFAFVINPNCRDEIIFEDIICVPKKQALGNWRKRGVKTKKRRNQYNCTTKNKNKNKKTTKQKQ